MLNINGEKAAVMLEIMEIGMTYWGFAMANYISISSFKIVVSYELKVLVLFESQNEKRQQIVVHHK